MPFCLSWPHQYFTCHPSPVITEYYHEMASSSVPAPLWRSAVCSVCSFVHRSTADTTPHPSWLAWLSPRTPVCPSAECVHHPSTHTPCTSCTSCPPCTLHHPTDPRTLHLPPHPHTPLWSYKAASISHGEPSLPRGLLLVGGTPRAGLQPIGGRGRRGQGALGPLLS